MDTKVHGSTSDTFDDEKVDAARDLLRLFGRARRFVRYARMMRERDGMDPQAMLAEVRRRLSEAILDDCLFFDEPTTHALFDFAIAWRAAAYECSPDDAPAADAALDSSYRRVAEVFSGQGM